jgi:endonuclease VIII
VAEGDTILRAARRLDAALAGRRVKVRAPSPRGAATGVERLDGLLVESVNSHGKHLLLRFDRGLVLHSHVGMSGSWEVYEHGARWRKPPRFAWAALATEEHEAVQFGGPTLRVLETRRMRLDPALSALGPDILAEPFPVADAVRSLRGAERSRELGDALLDQRLLAGVGNIFKSEGCFAARMSPWRRLDDLSEEELAAVITATRELMREAASSGRHRHRVYRAAGRPCPRCGARLRSRGQGDANRTTYWCPRCQPEAGRGPR